jgi:hypothetical protein
MTRPSSLAIGMLLLATAVADAQSRSSGSRSSGSSFGSSGSSFGSNAAGSGTSISEGFGSQGFGDTSNFGQSTGMSALSSGMGGSATGLGRSSSSSSGSGNRTRTNASASGQMSRTGVSSNRNSVAGMGGQRSPGRSSMMGNMGGLSSMMSGMNGMNGMGRGALGNRGVGVQQSVRPVIRVNMAPPPSLAPIVVAQALNSAISQAPSLSGVRQLNVNVDASGVATIQGSAATPHDRTLAAAMLSLQPGVRSVKNEIALPPIASPPATNR